MSHVVQLLAQVAQSCEDAADMASAAIPEDWTGRAAEQHRRSSQLVGARLIGLADMAREAAALAQAHQTESATVAAAMSGSMVPV